jgi:Stage II sporulation protein E (SpoIIE)
VTAGRLTKVAEQPALGSFLDTLLAIQPNIGVVIRDEAGREIAARGGTNRGTGASASRPILVDDDLVGEVSVDGAASPDDAIAIAVLLGSALSLAARAAPFGPIVATDAIRQEVARRQLEGELAIGRQIQRSLMPRRFPAFPGWEIAAAYDAAREVGGDLYDAFLLRDRPGELAIVVADVTGKGIPAAILMADLRALIHAAADHAPDPATALERVNHILVTERLTSLFATVAHAFVDGRAGVLTLASAGHEPVHVVRRDGSVTVLEPPGRLIGMVGDIAVAPVRTSIEPGDAIVVHTDGITEARAPDGAFYGDDRYRELLGGLAGQPATTMVDAIVADVAAFRAGAEASDDLTLLIVRREPVPAVDADPG